MGPRSRRPGQELQLNVSIKCIRPIFSKMVFQSFFMSTMIQPLLLAEAFGVRDYGRIYSLSQLVSTAGYASGTGVIAFLFNRFGGYREAFFVAALVTLVALLGLLLAGRPTRTH